MNGQGALLKTTLLSQADLEDHKFHIPVKFLQQ